MGRLQKQIQKNNLCSIFKTYLDNLPASCARNEVLLVNGVETYIVEWRFYFVFLCSKYFRDIRQQIVNMICSYPQPLFFFFLTNFLLVNGELEKIINGIQQTSDNFMYIDESQESNVIVHEPITGNNEVLDTQYDGLLDNYGIFDSQEYFLSSDKKDKQEEFDKTKENKLEEINNEDNETKDIIGASSGTYRTYHSILSKKSKKIKRTTKETNKETKQTKKQTKKQRYSESFKIDNDHIPPFNSMKGRELFRYQFHTYMIKW